MRKRCLEVAEVIVNGIHLDLGSSTTEATYCEFIDITIIVIAGDIKEQIRIQDLDGTYLPYANGFQFTKESMKELRAEVDRRRVDMRCLGQFWIPIKHVIEERIKSINTPPQLK